jgi:hypothetical protein
MGSGLEWAPGRDGLRAVKKATRSGKGTVMVEAEQGGEDLAQDLEEKLKILEALADRIKASPADIRDRLKILERMAGRMKEISLSELKERVSAFERASDRLVELDRPEVGEKVRILERLAKQIREIQLPDLTEKIKAFEGIAERIRESTWPQLDERLESFERISRRLEEIATPDLGEKLKALARIKEIKVPDLGWLEQVRKMPFAMAAGIGVFRPESWKEVARSIQSNHPEWNVPIDVMASEIQAAVFREALRACERPSEDREPVMMLLVAPE